MCEPDYEYGGDPGDSVPDAREPVRNLTRGEGIGLLVLSFVLIAPLFVLALCLTFAR
jgi:hypothetical protein